ncbi:MAG: aldose 1-epimerase family protein [Clostridia bacterium]|nr:aldose 1-epimerase family protein [Clostridia bacterium]
MRNPKISNLRQLAYLDRYTLTSGRGAGLDVIECDNGRIRFLLCPSRALDVMQMWHRGENVSFISKNGFVSEKVPFLSRFEGGMLYTCGLDSAGGREGFEQHGTHHLTGAEVTLAECTDEGITVEATVRETALFGRNLVFKRRVFTALGSDTLSITDTVTNEAYLPAEYCILYHVNVGYPMLDEGAEVVADVKDVFTRTDYARRYIDRALIMEEPTYPEETCYYLELAKPEISLLNKKRGKRFTVKYSGDTLPEFLMWKSMVAGDFALGLEPTTTRLDSTFSYNTLEAGESVKFTLNLSVEEI